MKNDRRFRSLEFRLAGWIGTLFLISALVANAAPKPPPPHADEKGLEIARSLSSMVPLQNSTNLATLIIGYRSKQRVDIPVRVMIVTNATGWQTTYETMSTNPAYAARMTVWHTPGKPGTYQLSKGEGAGGAPKELPLTGLMVPFAGSDFWVSDLGLAFLRWPTQRLLRNEMSRGQSCHVLESIAPTPHGEGYVRVVSWIDIDTGGIVEAEAYDAAGKLLKYFNPVKFERVNGRHEIKEIEMENEQKRTKTRLEFLYPDPKKGVTE